MISDQESRRHKIAHSHAIAAAVGSAIPVPGLGIAADTVIMTIMCISLCVVFGGNMTGATAKAMVIVVIKNTTLKQPIKTMAKELSKLVPGLGSVVAPTISVALLEAAGWTLVKELEQKFS